jgi:hypothetical protein
MAMTSKVDMSQLTSGNYWEDGDWLSIFAHWLESQNPPRRVFLVLERDSLSNQQPMFLFITNSS